MQPKTVHVVRSDVGTGTGTADKRLNHSILYCEILAPLLLGAVQLTRRELAFPFKSSLELETINGLPRGVSLSGLVSAGSPNLFASL